MTDPSAEHKREGPQPLDAYEYDKGEVVKSVDGHFWRVTERLWNHDAVNYDRDRQTGKKYEDTVPWHHREYELTDLDPESPGTETQRVNESQLTHSFTRSTEEAAREFYNEVKASAE